MTTGEIIALVAVGLNAVAYLSGAFKIAGTVSKLDALVTKIETTLTGIDNRLADTETDVAVLQNNCKIYHPQG